MPAQPLEWLNYRDWQPGASTAIGELRVLPEGWSPQLQNARPVVVLLPPSYWTQKRRRYPVLYMHDGQNLFDRATGFAGQEWDVDETLMQLATEGREAIVVGVWNTPLRFPEYNPFTHYENGRGADYLAFLADTLKPQIDGSFRTLSAAVHTGIIGSSMGGLISLYGFFHRPETFGFAGVMSPSTWVGGGSIYPYVSAQMHRAGRLYLDNGTRESSARKLHATLLARGWRDGQDMRYVVEAEAEHNEAAWARRLPDALRFLLQESHALAHPHG